MTKHFLNLMLALVLASVIAVSGNAKDEPAAPDNPTPQVVTVGFYPLNVYGVDTTSGTFYFDGYVWLRWNGDIDPSATIEFTNAVNKSSIAKTLLYEEPQTMQDGSKYQIMRIESQFFHPFSMASFPLDSHDLNITVEDSLLGVDQLIYQIDEADSAYSPAMIIAGWNLTGWTSENGVNDYQSTFGDTRPTTQASQFSQLSFNLNIDRPESYFIWKLLLPLFVVLCGAWIALLLNPVLTETRAALPASALLTTVFLQQSYNSALPETGGLVLLDKIYVIAYILIVVTLARVIINSRAVEKMGEPEILALRRRDGIALCIQAATFVAGTATLICVI